MTGDIEELRKNMRSYHGQRKWKELIATSTQVMKLARNSNERFDALQFRGFAHDLMDNDDQAIADYDEAIRLVPQNVNSYLLRGAVYYKKGEYGKAIASYDEAIRLAPERASAYLGRGLSYGKKGDHDQAILDFEEAIRLAPKNAHGYWARSVIYRGRQDYRRMLADLIQVGRLEPMLKVVDPAVYTASWIDAIYGDNNEDWKESVRFCFELLETIRKIRVKLFYSSEVGEVTHYTSLHTLKKMVVKESRFRLYNAARMNDPEEGRVFFQIMDRYGGEKGLESVFYENANGQSHRSPAYIGSFTIVDECNLEQQKDELFLWRTYGKHDGEEAAGSCLVFDRRCFADRDQMRTGIMEQLQTGTTEQTNPTGYLGTIQDAPLSICKVFYKDSKEAEEFDLTEELKEMARLLKEAKTYLSLNPEKESGLLVLFRDLLDSVRFLFKSRSYAGEREVRLVGIRHYGEDLGQESDTIKVDVDCIPLRFYIEAPESCRFNEVILGPKVREMNEWKRWIKDQDPRISVKKSGHRYGRLVPDS